MCFDILLVYFSSYILLFNLYVILNILGVEEIIIFFLKKKKLFILLVLELVVKIWLFWGGFLE